MKSPVLFIGSLWLIASLHAQSSLDGSTFSLRLGTTLSAKNHIIPMYIEPAGVDYYSKSTPGYEGAVAYRLTRRHYRYCAAFKAGWYAIDKRFTLSQEESQAGYKVNSRAITLPLYFGLETSLEARLHCWKNGSFFLGPALQLVHSPSAFLELDDFYLDNSYNIHDVYRSDDLIVNEPNQPYVGFGGKLSLEKPITKRLGVAITVGYFYCKRNILDVGTYTLYTNSGPLHGSLTKPFQYWLFGVEFSLLRKKT